MGTAFFFYIIFATKHVCYNHNHNLQEIMASVCVPLDMDDFSRSPPVLLLQFYNMPNQ